MSSKKLAALNALLATPESEGFSRVPLGHAEADTCLKGGLRRGVLHEVFATPGHEVAATGFAAGLAARASMGRRVMWITQDFLAHEFGALSAAGLLELGLDPDRLLLFQADGTADALQAAHDALSCPALGAIILEIQGNPAILDLTASRRLTLAAAKNHVTVCLLRFVGKTMASAAETRWLVRSAPSQQGDDWGYPVFEAELIRHRNGGTGRWIMEWSCDHGLFKTPAAHPVGVVSISANRPLAARGSAEGLRQFAA